jgi:hypothetical protein
MGASGLGPQRINTLHSAVSLHEVLGSGSDRTCNGGGVRVYRLTQEGMIVGFGEIPFPLL